MYEKRTGNELCLKSCRAPSPITFNMAWVKIPYSFGLIKGVCRNGIAWSWLGLYTPRNHRLSTIVASIIRCHRLSWIVRLNNWNTRSQRITWLANRSVCIYVMLPMARHSGKCCMNKLVLSIRCQYSCTNRILPKWLNHNALSIYHRILSMYSKSIIRLIATWSVVSSTVVQSHRWAWQKQPGWIFERLVYRLTNTSHSVRRRHLHWTRWHEFCSWEGHQLIGNETLWSLYLILNITKDAEALNIK